MTAHVEAPAIVDARHPCGRRWSVLLLWAVVVGMISLAALGCEESRSPAKAPSATSAATQKSSSESTTEDAKATAAAPDTATAEAMTTSTDAAPSNAPATPTAKAEPPVAEQAAAPAADDAAIRNITFDRIKFDLKANADYKPELLTPEIKALDGKNVRIRGFMFPSFKPTGLTEWVLVRDNLQCCFGGNAILYDCIIVDMKPGKSTDYTTRPVAVEGTFTIKDWFDIDGVRRAIYHLDGESVRF